jgi:RHS repeat-associated protein
VTRVIERSGAFTYGTGPNAGDLATTYTYDTIGDLDLIELPEGNAIFHDYDHVGRLIERARRATAGGANLERTTWTYDDMGHRTREEHANLVGGTTVTSATEWSYANGCQLNAVVHNPSPFGSGDVVTSYDYDCEGRLWKTWDANHPVGSFPNDYTEYAYDALDRLSSVTQPWGGTGHTEVTTSYGYDPQDHLTSVEDGEGNVTTYRYSDRDLLMVEDSPVSGVTRHLYGDGGELTLTRDGRGIDTTRTLDDAGRVTAIAYSGAPGLGVTFTYGSSAIDNEIGRLVGNTRHGATIDYEYDEFGRTTKDGGLVFGYDDNGNRTSITYPDGLVVEYTFDHADREESLTADPSGENLSVVSAASYLPAGPLSGLTFGNGRSEDRAFTGRYFPERITLEPTGGGSPLLDWEYTTDDVGNPTLIDDLVGSPDRSYAYQAHQYFLTDAAGPWPGPLEWTYDTIGNRLSEDRNSVVDTYDYTLNGAAGRTALLETVNLAGGVGGRDYQYTAAGHVTQVDAGANVVDFLVDEEGRLGGLERVAGDAGSAMLYDGRGFLSRVEGFELTSIILDGFERETTECWSDGVPTPPSPDSPCSSAFRIVEPVYDSAGLLHALGITETLLGSSSERVLYLAGRPVAIARGEVGALDLLYLTTDHLGTPIAACDDTGALQWSGGFEPFGTDWLAGTSGGASENGVWLRFPGQWEDSSWREAETGAKIAHNVFRWYGAEAGRYTKPDPVRRARVLRPYAYASNQPTLWVDPLGLEKVKCTDCEEVREQLATALGYLNNLRRFGSEFGPSTPPSTGSGVPLGTSPCGQGGRTWTEFGPQAPTFADSPCAALCLSVHEREHRKRCVGQGFDAYVNEGYDGQEIHAYKAEIACQRSAIENGYLDLSMDGVAPCAGCPTFN